MMSRSNKSSLVVVLLACAATIGLAFGAVFVRGRVNTLRAADAWTLEALREATGAQQYVLPLDRAVSVLTEEPARVPAAPTS